MSKVRLSFSAADVLGQALEGVTLAVTVNSTGTSQVVTLPAQVDLPDDLAILDLQIPVSSMMPWGAQLLQQSGLQRWRTSDPTLTVTETPNGTSILITLCRVRFAPVYAFDENQQIPFSPGKIFPLDFNPQGAMVFLNASPPIYRDVWLNLEQVRTINYPAVGNPTAQSWKRFNTRPAIPVDLKTRGCFVLLEYGDPPNVRDGLRFLISAWAPLQFAGATPVTIVQITPNTQLPGYPLDAPPFGKVYPYALALDRSPTKDEIKAKSIRLGDLRQPYCDLPGNRTVVSYKAIYQIYAARPDIFGPDTDEGPVLITPVPVALNTKELVQRSPFDNPRGLARLVREVLHFLAASRLSAQGAGNRPQLRFRPPATDVVTMPPNPSLPVGPPQGRARITVVTHSAGIFALLPLVSQGVMTGLPTLFPAATWAAPEADFRQDWRGLWLIDGVGQPGRINSPVADSNVARSLTNWARSGQRRLVAVYTTSGIADKAINGLVKNPIRKGDSSRWIEEGRSPDGTSITWLRMTDAYLSPADASDRAWPTFGVPKDPHNFIYDIGIGYAAASSAR